LVIEIFFLCVFIVLFMLFADWIMKFWKKKLEKNLVISKIIDIFAMSKRAWHRNWFVSNAKITLNDELLRSQQVKRIN
jgi:hypothetical protein